MEQGIGTATDVAFPVHVPSNVHGLEWRRFTHLIVLASSEVHCRIPAAKYVRNSHVATQTSGNLLTFLHSGADKHENINPYRLHCAAICKSKDSVGDLETCSKSDVCFRRLENPMHPANEVDRCQVVFQKAHALPME